MTINADFKSAVAALVAAGSTDSGASGMRVDVETVLAPTNAARRDLSTERSFLESAFQALPNFFTQYLGQRRLTPSEADGHNDRVAFITVADGSVWFVGRVK